MCNNANAYQLANLHHLHMLAYTEYQKAAAKFFPQFQTGNFLKHIHFSGYITPSVYWERPVFAAIHLLYLVTCV